MANQYLNALTDTWNNAGTTFQGISLNVTNSASAADSKLLRLQVGSTDKFSVDKNGNVVAAGTITSAGAFTSGGAVLPPSNDGGALGASGTAFSDLFLASGAVINWNAGDVALTHSANLLAFTGASSGYSFDAALLPSANDAAAIGAAATSWSDLFLASGGVINWANGDAVVTHSAGVITVSTGDLRVTTAGTNAASAVTVGGTQTLANKALSDSTTTIIDENDGTKIAKFQASGITAGQTRTVTFPDKSGTMAMTSDISAAVPVGTIAAYGGTAAPSLWLLCYGQAISRTTYADLFTAISTTYGVGDGTTTFNLPDIRGRVIAGQDDMGGVSADRLTNQSGGLNGDTLGATGGTQTHTLTEAEMPAHTHTVTASGTTQGGSAGSVADNVSSDTGSTGGGGAHNNVQPTIILNYIIYTGV